MGAEELMKIKGLKIEAPAIQNDRSVVGVSVRI